MTHQYFVEKANGDRQSITGLQCQILRVKHGYRQIIATEKMTVVKNINLRCPRKPERNYILGGGRLRNPYESLGV